MKLRKRLPYYCLHKNLSGQPDHLLQPLTDQDGDICKSCVQKDKEAQEKFWTAPIRSAAPNDLPKPKPHWPFWPGAKSERRPVSV